MAAEQFPDDGQRELDALHQQAMAELQVEQDMARWHIAEGDDGVPVGSFARIAAIILSRRHGSHHKYHDGGRGQARPDYQRGSGSE